MSRVRILHNVFLMGTGQIATWFLSAAYLMLLGRYFGPANLGVIGLAWSLSGLAMMVVRLGMETLITRTVARDPVRAGGMVTAAIAVRSLLAIPMLCVLALYVHLSHLSVETEVTAYIVLGSQLISSFASVMGAVFQAHEIMTVDVVSKVLRSINEIGVVLLTIMIGGGVVFFLAAMVPIEVFLLLYSVRRLRPLARLSWKLSGSAMREIAVGSLPFWLGGVFLGIYTAVDSLMLAALAGTTAVGYYTPALRVCSIGLFLPTIVGIVTLPLLSRLSVDRREDFVRASRKTLSLLLVFAVPLTVGMTTFAGPLILTIYGPAYRPSIPVLQVVSFMLIPTFLNMQASITLDASNRQWRWAAVLAASCVLNPLINLLLVPFAVQHWHNGALGAGITLLITEAGMAAYSFVPLRAIVDRAFLRALGGALLAGAVQAATIRLVSGAGPILAESAGVLTYAVAALLFRAVEQEEARFFLESALQFIRRAPRRLDGITPRQTDLPIGADSGK